MTAGRERRRWAAMLDRCENPRSSAYQRYGARGIGVCERWHDFEAFCADITELLGPWVPGVSLDRIDNDGGYEPGNVRWATPRLQGVNSRNCPPGPDRDRRIRELAEQTAAILAAGRATVRPAASEQPSPPRWLKPGEVCSALGISRADLQHLIAAGDLAALDVGIGRRPHYRISEASIEEYISRLLPERQEATP